MKILNYTKSGQPFWNLFHLAPIFSRDDGQVLHFVGVQTLISGDGEEGSISDAHQKLSTETDHVVNGVEAGELGAGGLGAGGLGLRSWSESRSLFGTVARESAAGEVEGEGVRDFGGGAEPDEANGGKEEQEGSHARQPP